MPNRLADAHSAYLRSAQHQPVDWYPWCREAFERARDDDRPILLDIGAVWCHWCHVMDHESYEDPAIAELLNREWVCIKVDRDERPDVDARYQRAVQALTGQGGWPLTAFLTPDGEVFYAGTYFPPDGRMGRPGFRSVLISLARAYREITRHLTEAQGPAAAGTPTEGVLSTATESITKLFDARHGGFGTQPKFPHPGACELLLARWFDTGDDSLRKIVDRTLTAMAEGGIHDQLGGGFHRYSVDAKWIVPHFEKMLYDNAELLKAYVSASGAALPDDTGGQYVDVVEGIVRWMGTVMSDPDGGYYASQDADVDPGDDGNYFTWTIDEARAVLTPDEFTAAARHYDIGPRGEMHHDPSRNVLWVAASVEEIAAEMKRPATEVGELLQSARATLLRHRDTRTAPFVDPTLYTAWNAMMASAMLRASALLERSDVEAHAILTLERFFAATVRTEAGLAAPHALGGEVTDMLDDQVQLAAAALDALESTGNTVWLDRAEALMRDVWAGYRAAEGGLSDVRTGRGGDGFLTQELVPVQDTPTPSPNGTAALVLGRLAAMTGAADWVAHRNTLLAELAGGAADLSIYGAALLRAIDWAVSPVTHVVIVGGDDAPTRELHRAACVTYRPRTVVRLLSPGAPTDGLPPELTAMLDGTSPRAYVCAGMQCAPPVAAPEALVETLQSFGR